MAKQTKTETKLIRCVCGEVLDAGKIKVCPSCGTEVQLTSKKAVPSAPAEKITPQPKPAAPKEVKEPLSAEQRTLYRNIMIGAGVLLLAAFLWPVLTRHSGSSLDRPPAGPAPVKFSKTMDKALVATWTMQMPGVNGTFSKWILDIHKDGTYSFNATGQGPIGAHSGKMEADKGYWRLQSTQGFPWTDQGTYYLNGGNSMVLTGKLGSGTWYRE